MPKFHALSVIQDQLRGNGMNLIPCVCDCVCAYARARARVCVCVGGWVCMCVYVCVDRSIVRCIWMVMVNFCLLKAEVKR